MWAFAKRGDTGASTSAAPPPRQGGHAAAERARSVMAAPGRPMESGVRRRMQAHLGYPLGAVRVHDDAEAARSARELGARAYTVGGHVVFGPGRYRPETPDGFRLLAHELAHVVQAGQGRIAPETEAPLRLSHPSDPLEREADQVAERAAGGGGPRLTPAQALAFHVPAGPGLAVQRAPEDETATQAAPAPADQAQPTGVLPQPRPAPPSSALPNDPLEYHETPRFTVDDGRVRVQIQAGWDPPSAEGPREYTVMLMQWGVVTDSVRRVFIATVGRSEVVTWTDLENASYYVRVVPKFNAATNSRLSGSMTIT
jgi:hypothetical protein